MRQVFAHSSFTALFSFHLLARCSQDASRRRLWKRYFYGNSSTQPTNVRTKDGRESESGSLESRSTRRYYCRNLSDFPSVLSENSTPHPHIKHFSICSTSNRSLQTTNTTYCNKVIPRFLCPRLHHPACLFGNQHNRPSHHHHDTRSRPIRPAVLSLSNQTLMSLLTHLCPIPDIHADRSFLTSDL